MKRCGKALSGESLACRAIGHANTALGEEHGYSVVREYCGHGVGQEMHEDLAGCCICRPGEGAVLQKAWCVSIEPMLTWKVLNNHCYQKMALDRVVTDKNFSTACHGLRCSASMGRLDDPLS